MELTITEYKKLIKNTKPKQKFIDILTNHGAQFEHKFLKDRKFKFDAVFLEQKIAFEYEGIFSEHSRHTSIKGYIRDCEKYNLAAIEGWRVLRYTAKNIKNLQGDLSKIITQSVI